MSIYLNPYPYHPNLSSLSLFVQIIAKKGPQCIALILPNLPPPLSSVESSLKINTAHIYIPYLDLD